MRGLCYFYEFVRLDVLPIQMVNSTGRLRVLMHRRKVSASVGSMGGAEAGQVARRSSLRFDRGSQKRREFGLHRIVFRFREKMIFVVELDQLSALTQL